MSRVESDVWFSVGFILYGDPVEVRLWTDGKFDLKDRTIVPFRYWCSDCKAPFESLTTPVKCPAGHKAEDQPDHVVLVHKKYEAATFPFPSTLIAEIP